MNNIEEQTKKLVKCYPMADDALKWYGGKHCPRCGTFIEVKPFGFESGWDSALRKVLSFFQK
jgi:hypothetical protein